MHTGYVAWPDCFNTLGLLGAVSSFSMVHFASPVPVLVAVQPAGAVPAAKLSKLTTSASSTTARHVSGSVSIAATIVFIEASSILNLPRTSEVWTAVTLRSRLPVIFHRTRAPPGGNRHDQQTAKACDKRFVRPAQLGESRIRLRRTIRMNTGVVELPAQMFQVLW